MLSLGSGICGLLVLLLLALFPFCCPWQDLSGTGWWRRLRPLFHFLLLERFCVARQLAHALQVRRHVLEAGGVAAELLDLEWFLDVS